MISGIDSTQPTKRNNARLMLTSLAGAAVGAGSRYLLPTKAEWGSMRNSADTFFSNAATSARGANRSILKYSVLGAIVALGAHLISRFIKSGKEKFNEEIDTFEYKRIQAIVDSPDYACEVFLYQ